MVRSEGKTPTRRADRVCICGSLLQRQVRDTDLLEIVVGEEKTLAKFSACKTVERGHRTERSGRVCVCHSLLQREREASGTRRVVARETFWNRGWEARNSRLFSKWYVLREDTDQKGDPVCICGSLLQRQVRDRDLFDIVVGQEKTLAKFLLDNGGEGHRTERSGRVWISAVSLLQRERAASGRRDALWRERDLLESWLRSSKLSPFFQKWYVLKDTHRPQKGNRVYVWVSAAEAGERQRPF